MLTCAKSVCQFWEKLNYFRFTKKRFKFDGYFSWSRAPTSVKDIRLSIARLYICYGRIVRTDWPRIDFMFARNGQIIHVCWWCNEVFKSWYIIHFTFVSRYKNPRYCPNDWGSKAAPPREAPTEFEPLPPSTPANARLQTFSRDKNLFQAKPIEYACGQTEIKKCSDRINCWALSLLPSDCHKRRSQNIPWFCQDPRILDRGLFSGFSVMRCSR